MTDAESLVMQLEACCPLVAVKVVRGLSGKYLVAGYDGRGERVLVIAAGTPVGAKRKFIEAYDKAVWCGAVKVKARSEGGI